MTTALLAVWTTVATREDAQRIAETCVRERLAACVQLSPIDSVYEWQGALQQEAEVRLLLKTTAGRYPALAQRLRQLHPYELPAIFALPVAEAASDYIAWVEAQTCAPS